MSKMVCVATKKQQEFPMNEKHVLSYNMLINKVLQYINVITITIHLKNGTLHLRMVSIL